MSSFTSFYKNTKPFESIRNWRDNLIPIKINDGDIKQISDIYKLDEEKQRDDNRYEHAIENTVESQG